MDSLVRITLVGDGTSDRCLVPIIEWIHDQKFLQVPVIVQYATHLPPARTGLRNRMLAAIHNHPCDALVIHRDAERQPLAHRINEILGEATGLSERCVPVVPVRMTESWLLLDEKAIRQAADNPSGTQPLSIPSYKRWEKLPDPKEDLFTLLRKASGLTGRRLDRFDPYAARHRVAMLINDFTPLRQLTAFAQFEATLSAAIGDVVNAF
jgi:hypothetical protein